MEKIQQALEKARQEREKGTADTGTSKERGELVDAADIQYTQTRLFSSSETIQRENRLVAVSNEKDYVESFKILSTQVIQRLEENNWKSLAVTSVSDGEGATTTAINLGISIAKEVEYTVLVVDANLREPELHAHFGIKPKYGLCDYLKQNIDLSDILIKPDNIDHFVILPGGEPISNSSEMLGSPKMRSLVSELTERYPKRIILFDLPPVLGTADTMSFIPNVDAALLVIEDDVTREADLKQAVETLSVTNILGTVLNKAMY